LAAPAGGIRAEAAEDHVPDRPVHGSAHDVAQDGAGGADERADDDQQVVREHETGRRGRPAGVAVEHRDDDGHVRAADGDDEVHAEDAGDRGHDEQRREAGVALGLHEHDAEHDAGDHHCQVEGVARGQQQRLAADAAAQLQERDDRTREGDRADEDVDEDFDEQDRAAADVTVVRPEVAGETDDDGGRTDEAVQQRDELGHGRHRDAGGHDGPNAGADDQGTDERGVGVEIGAERGRHDGGGHADDAVEVAAAGRLLTGEPAEAEDEQRAGDDVGDGEKGGVHGRLTSGTSSACAGSPGTRLRC
jgi:hypothetical protein